MTNPMPPQIREFISFYSFQDIIKNEASGGYSENYLRCQNAHDINEIEVLDYADEIAIVFWDKNEEIIYSTRERKKP